MAVTVAGTPTSQAGTADTTSTTFAWNNSASANYLVVGVSSWDATAGDAVVSGVTYNGVSMTSLGSRQDAGNEAVSLWGLANPAAGSNNVVVTMGGACSEHIAGAVGFTGVHASTPAGSFAGADYGGVNSGTATVNVTSQTDALVIGVLYVNNNPTEGGGQTSQWEVFAYGGTYGAGCTEAGAASVTVSYTFTSTSWCIGGVSIQPAAAGSSSVSPSVSPSASVSPSSSDSPSVSPSASLSPSSSESPSVSPSASVSPSSSVSASSSPSDAGAVSIQRNVFVYTTSKWR
jgi:hypothetical protein